MTGPSGKGLDGRTSHRCLDNTGPRRWLVVEFDPKKFKDLSLAEQLKYGTEGGYISAKLDEQAALHWHFRAAAIARGWPRLALCVHSGGKSLHGWYGPCRDEGETEAFMNYAKSLGADDSTKNRCQLIRLPGGVRKREVDIAKPISLPDGWEDEPQTVRQPVMYFEKETA
jgi:hypothetical protein